MAEETMESFCTNIKDRVKDAAGKWSEDRWDGQGVRAVAWFLRGDDMNLGAVIEGAAGLMDFGLNDESELTQLAGRGEKQFEEKLEAKGLCTPVVVKLWAKYGSQEDAGASSSSSSSSSSSGNALKRTSQHAELGGSSSSSSSSSGVDQKRPKLANRCSEGATDVIMAGFTDSVTKNETGNLWTFEHGLLDASSGQNTMFVREQYPVIYNKVLEFSADPAKRGSIITGTSGTGKTILGMYIINRLVTTELKTVVFNFRNQELSVFAPPKKVLEGLPANDPRREILKHWGAFAQRGRLDGESEEDMEKSSWWGKIDMEEKAGQDLYKALMNMAHVWLVVDLLHDEEFEEEPTKCFVLVVGSLRDDKFEGLCCVDDMLFVSVWDIKEVVRFLEAREADQEDIEEMRQRFARFGGSARLLFNKGDHQDVLDNALNRLDFSELQKALDPWGAAPNLTSILVHVTVSDDHTRTTGRKFASTEFAQRLLDKLMPRNDFNFTVWLQATGTL